MVNTDDNDKHGRTVAHSIGKKCVNLTIRTVQFVELFLQQSIRNVIYVQVNVHVSRYCRLHSRDNIFLALYTLYILYLSRVKNDLAHS